MLGLIALGSNLGDRRRTLQAALAELGRLPATRLVGASPWEETAPERPQDGGPFLNGVALLETGLTPRTLLRELLALERRFGRRRRAGLRGPRTLDLDLIVLGGLARSEPGLELPHPRFRGRAFVLGPAARVAPRLRDPGTGRTLARLRRDLEERS